MWITLFAFIAGATLAAWDGERWMAWPALPGQRLGEGWATLPISLTGLALVWAAMRWLEGPQADPLAWRGGDVLRGPWPLLWGAVALAVLNFTTLLLAGRPWAITAAFPLWGSQLVESLGWDDPAFWAYWEDPTRSEALLRPLLSDRTTLMDLGLMAGALLAAGLAGRRGAVRQRVVAAAAAAGADGEVPEEDARRGHVARLDAGGEAAHEGAVGEGVRGCEARERRRVGAGHRRRNG